jgi:hypothetical protein
MQLVLFASEGRRISNRQFRLLKSLLNQTVYNLRWALSPDHAVDKQVRHYDEGSMVGWCIQTRKGCGWTVSLSSGRLGRFWQQVWAAQTTPMLGWIAVAFSCDLAPVPEVVGIAITGMEGYSSGLFCP